MPTRTFEKAGWLDEWPPTVPQWPSAERGVVRPSSGAERELAAAHHVLDALGVPSIADIDVTMEDDTETVYATHDLRVNGRIEYLAQRLAELGVALPFESHQARLATESQPQEQK